MAQNNAKSGVKKNQTHKIVFQMVSKDNADHNAMVRQLNNILELSPGTKLEVVCHGPGLSFIHKDKSLVLNDLGDLANKKVDFVACEFTMQQKNIKREQDTLGFEKPLESFEQGFATYRNITSGISINTQIFGTKKFSKGFIRGIATLSNQMSASITSQATKKDMKKSSIRIQDKISIIHRHIVFSKTDHSVH